MLALAVTSGLLLTLLLYFYSNAIFKVWLGGGIHIDHSLVIAFAFFAPISVIVASYSTLWFALGIRFPLVVMFLAMMFINLAITVYLIPRVGTIGAIVGTSAAYFVCLVIPFVILTPHYLRSGWRP